MMVMRISCLLVHCRNTKLNIDDLLPKIPSSHGSLLTGAHVHFQVTSALTNVSYISNITARNTGSFVYTPVTNISAEHESRVEWFGFSFTEYVGIS